MHNLAQQVATIYHYPAAPCLHCCTQDGGSPSPEDEISALSWHHPFAEPTLSETWPWCQHWHGPAQSIINGGDRAHNPLPLCLLSLSLPGSH